MGFVGRFEMTVPDILQILSLSKKTGKLRLSQLGNTGEVLFKNGKVTFAASDSTRYTLSNTLISQRHLTESALMAALELQHLSSDNKRLGAILIEKGIITREVLQEALRSQIEQVMSEFLSWENGFFRFDMIEIAADDGIAIDVSEFLTKSGIQPELFFHEGASPVYGRREVETPPRPERFDVAHRPEPVEGLVEGPRPERFDVAHRPEPVEGLVEGPRPPPPHPPVRPERFDRGFDGEPSTRAQAEGLSRTAETSAEPFGGEPSTRAQAEGQLRAVEPLSRMPRPEQVEGARPEPLDSARGKPVEGRVEGPRPSPEILADLIEGQWEGERPPWIKPESSSSPSPAPDPTPTVRIEERRQVPPSPEPPARPDRAEGPRPTPEVPLRPAPAVPRPERFDVPHRPERVEGLVEGLAAETPTASIPAGRERFDVAHRPERVEGPPVPAPVAPSGISLEGPFEEIEPSRITDEIMLNSPIAPWVLIMHLAADVVSRGVLLFVRKDGITGHDQFGVGGGRDSGDERVINIKIPWKEPSILAATSHARTTYRGKIGPGKWNDYFLNQLGGKRPDEAVIIPIIVAGKVVAIFYGDDAGSGTPLGDVERLQALIDQTFSAVEASILEKRGKASF